MTYTTLLEDLRGYIERGFASDPEVYNQLPRLITRAQQAICDELKIQGNIEVVSSAMVVGQFSYAKPNRWRRTVSMLFGTGVGGATATPIYPRSYEYCRMYAPDPSVLGIPAFYGDYDYFHWIIVPTPQLAYTWEISYYQLPPLIDDVTQTNWITEFMPNALLYRTLLDTAVFLKNDERVAVFGPLYKQALGTLDTEDLKKIVDRSTTRNEA
jgi:hypothetical protein